MDEKISGVIDTFANRLNLAIKIRNIKPIALSEITGISRSSLSEYMNGKYEAKQNGIYLLSKALNVDEAWLMGADVPMERQKHKEESNVFPISDIPTEVPVLGRISAGLPILAVENIEGYEFAPSTYLKEDFEYFYLKVQGDSMNLRFPEGNLVLVQKQDTLENGEIGVFLIDGLDATVKKYRKDGNFVILDPMSTNPSNITQIYNTKETPVKIIGKVVMHIGKV